MTIDFFLTYARRGLSRHPKGKIIMLETEIKNNTAALAALAAAVAELTAALRASAPIAAPVAPVTPAPAPIAGNDQRELYARSGVAGLSAGDVNLLAAAPVAPAPASMPPVNPVPAAAAPVAPAPASMPPVNPVPAAAAPVAPAPAMSGDDLRKLCVRAGAAGLTAEVVAFLSANGCQKLAQLPPEKYGDLVALLASKGVE